MKFMELKYLKERVGSKEEDIRRESVARLTLCNPAKHEIQNIAIVYCKSYVEQMQLCKMFIQNEGYGINIHEIAVEDTLENIGEIIGEIRFRFNKVILVISNLNEAKSLYQSELKSAYQSYDPFHPDSIYMAIFPVDENEGNWDGYEFLDQMATVKEWVEGKWGISNPKAPNEINQLVNWLNGTGFRIYNRMQNQLSSIQL